MPDYRFEKDRQHWAYRNAVDTGWPIEGKLHVKLERNDPQLIGPAGFWRARDVPKIFIHAACHTHDTNARLYWKTRENNSFTNNKSVSFNLRRDGQYHYYEIDLSSCQNYKGTITGLRLDPVTTGKEGDFIEIKLISWRKR